MADELLSQWIVRLAWRNRQKLNHFTWKQLGLPKSTWDRDIDRTMAEPLIDRIAEASGCDIARARETSLRAWQGILWERLAERGTPQWLMQPRIVGRFARAPALQYCPACLREDSPYFRRRWRLMLPFCAKHGTWLLDRCPMCASAINIHVADYGWQGVDDRLGWVFCGRCRHDLRSADVIEIPSSVALQNLVRQTDRGLSGEWVMHGGQPLHPLLYFRGLRILLCLLASNSKPAAVRRLASARGGPLAFRTAIEGKHLMPERLDVQERARLFELMAWTLDVWPHRFLETFERARVRSDSFRKAWDVPWWLERHVSTELNKSFYRPSPLERASATDFLIKRGRPVTRNGLRRLLGLSYVENHRYFKNR